MLHQDLGHAVERAELIGIERQRAAQISERRLIVVEAIFDVGAMAPGLGIVGRKIDRRIEERQRFLVLIAGRKYLAAIDQQIDRIAALQPPKPFDGRADVARLPVVARRRQDRRRDCRGSWPLLRAFAARACPSCRARRAVLGRWPPGGGAT